MADLEILTSCVQICFWATIAVVAVLTYRRAAATILQPLRTEVFKLQLEELKAVLTAFVGKAELELRQDLDFDRMLHVNIASMFDSYAKVYFDVKPEPSRRGYGPEHCAGGLISKESLLKTGKLQDGFLRNRPEDLEADRPQEPSLKAAIWADYEHSLVYIPKEHAAFKGRLESYRTNPLIPRDVLAKLAQYLEVVDTNTWLIQSLLREFARQMPHKYPNLDRLQESSYYWITNEFVERFYHLEPLSIELIELIRNRYDVDGLSTLNATNNKWWIELRDRFRNR